MLFNIREGESKDGKAVLRLIQELADYEKAPQEVEITVEQLIEDGFGKNPIYSLFVAEQDEEVIGMALFYEKYSTWKGRCTYLEDLVVTRSKRGCGVGKALFEAVMRHAKTKNSGRMEWQVLDWNTPAIEFYKSYGAGLDGEWFNGRFTKEQLQKMKLD